MCSSDLDDCVLYLKHSRSNKSPWQFSFSTEHLQTINTLETFKVDVKQIFVGLICGFHAIAVLSMDEISKLIDLNASSPQYIRVVTLHGRSLRLSGSQGKLGRTLSKTHPFKSMYEYLSNR